MLWEIMLIIIGQVKARVTVTSTYFEYKTKIMGNTPDDNNTLGTDVVIPLKYLSN